VKTDVHFWSHPAQFFLEWKVFHTNFVEKIKSQVLCSLTFFFFRKSIPLWNHVEKYCRAGQATDDNMAHVHCMLDNWDYRHTICNNYCFYAAAAVARTRLSVALYLYCLSWYKKLFLNECVLCYNNTLNVNNMLRSEVTSHPLWDSKAVLPYWLHTPLSWGFALQMPGIAPLSDE